MPPTIIIVREEAGFWPAVLAGSTGGAAGTGADVFWDGDGSGFMGSAAFFSSAFAGCAGGTGTGAAAGPIVAPQPSQNFAFGVNGTPHAGQAGGASIRAPQDSQNFMPGVTGLLHFGQVCLFAVMDTPSGFGFILQCDSISDLKGRLYAFCFLNRNALIRASILKKTNHGRK